MAIEIGRNQLPGQPYFSQTSHVTWSVEHKAQFKWRRWGVLLSVQKEEAGGTALQRAPLEKRFSCPQGVPIAGTEREMSTGDRAAGCIIPKGSTRGSKAGREENWVAATSHPL